MRVLIVGKRSYIGSRIKSHLESSGHRVFEADAENGEWETADYSSFDSVVHVAAIVHQNAKNADEAVFEKVNTQLPVSVAKLAKNSSVSQFVFISTMAVYGKNKSLKKAETVIDRGTFEAAREGYGGSKLKAEKQLKALEDDSFRVAVVRPPNVYGPGCRGNYIPLFGKLSLKLPICPYAFSDIRQSMLYIDNLSELIRLTVEQKTGGVYHPQDDEAPDAARLIGLIRSCYGKKTVYSKFLGFFVKLLGWLPVIKKIYGGIQYDYSLSACFENKYQIVSFEDGIKSVYK